MEQARRIARALTFLGLAAAVLAGAAFYCGYSRPAFAADDSYRPPAEDYDTNSRAPDDDRRYDERANSGRQQDSYRAPPSQSNEPRYSEPRQYDNRDGGDRYNDRDQRPPRRSAETPSDPGGYGAPYTPPGKGGEYYEQLPPDGPPPGESRGTYSQNEIVRTGHGFFGSVSEGLARAVEWAFQKAGRPNGYILGQDAGGAIVAGLRYGEGTLYTKDAGTHSVFWQGPSVGYDFGGEGSKTMVLVYDLNDPADIYQRFAGVEGAAYLVGGVSVQIQKAGNVTLAPIRSGVGLRLGANIGYLKYTRSPTWNPF